MQNSQHSLSYFLPYTAPYDWTWMTSFLGARALAGIEHFEHHENGAVTYRRTLSLSVENENENENEIVTGWLTWQPLPEQNVVALALSPSLDIHRDAVIKRVRNLLDLDADPQQIAETLGPLVGESAGLRLPGAIDSFELTVRAILGQLVSVKMAATFCARLAERWGEPIYTPFAELTRLFPTPARIATLNVDELRAIGVQAKRAACLINVARAVRDGELPLYSIQDTGEGIKQLIAMPGIGAWTANYIAMRAWGERDIFLHSDYLIKQRFPNMTPATINRYAKIWKPWRSYATLLIWNNANWKPK